MTHKTEMSFAPAVPAMRAALEPHATWLEQILGCPPRGRSPSTSRCPSVLGPSGPSHGSRCR